MLSSLSTLECMQLVQSDGETYAVFVLLLCLFYVQPVYSIPRPPTPALQWDLTTRQPRPLKPRRFVSQRIQERPDVTASGMSPVETLPAKYNVQWGYKNHSSSMNASDALATYRKKMRLILQKNKQLARALAASQRKTSKLEQVNKREQKIEKLALPRLKAWLEAGMQCLHDASINYSRAIVLLQAMSPERDLTLTDAADPDEPSTRHDLWPPFHPQGRPCRNECGNITVISEEDETMIRSGDSSLQVTALDPAVGQSPTLTMVTDEDHGEDQIPYCPVSPLVSSRATLGPLLKAAEQLEVNQCTSLEPDSVLIAAAASINSGHELDGSKMPPIFTAGAEEADFHLTEEPASSPKQVRVPPKPRKSVGKPSGSRSLGSRRRSSLSAVGRGRRNSSVDASPESFRLETERSTPGESEASSDVSLRSSTCPLDEAFVESPNFLAVHSSPVIPEKTDRIGEGHQHVPPSGASAETPPGAKQSELPPATLQTAKASHRKPRTSTEPMPVSSATDDDSVPRYSSGRPARRNSLGKNYKEPSLKKRLS